jgi:hypothetical protein
MRDHIGPTEQPITEQDRPAATVNNQETSDVSKKITAQPNKRGKPQALPDLQSRKDPRAGFPNNSTTQSGGHRLATTDGIVIGNGINLGNHNELFAADELNRS